MLPAGSATDPRPVRSSRIDPTLVPVTPATPTDTVHVALGDPPTADTALIVGVPVMPLRTVAKFEVATPDTGSENVTVHSKGPAFTACEAPARVIESTVGRVLSTMTDCGGAVPVLPATSFWVADTIRVPLVVHDVVSVQAPPLQFTVPALVPLTRTVTGARSPVAAPQVPPTELTLLRV